MPFRRDLAPGMLHRHAPHAEAAARISWCISEQALGVITGEVGAACPLACLLIGQPTLRRPIKLGIIAAPGRRRRPRRRPVSGTPYHSSRFSKRLTAMSPATNTATIDRKS